MQGACKISRYLAALKNIPTYSVATFVKDDNFLCGS